jgi:UDP-3-O-[3-hydroxymyristoyl] glucosamine N-acyltransferase
MTILLERLAQVIGADVVGLPAVEISGIAGLKEATPEEVSFLTSSRYESFLAGCRACAVIVSDRHPVSSNGPILLRVADPQLALVKAMEVFHPSRHEVGMGVHPTAVIAPGAEVGNDVSLHAHVVVEAGARIGDRAILMPGVFVGAGVELGDDVLIYPNAILREGVTLGQRVIVHAGAVIGADGFGFAPNGHGMQKIPQVGRVVIGDDVEIGANTTIDRATLGETVVGSGTKIDNLVQIGHNVKIGCNTVICAQVGVSGSVEVGDRVVLAGQAGIAGHIHIGDGVIVGAQAGVTRSIADGECVLGAPARPRTQAGRRVAMVSRLPQMLERLRELEARISELEPKGEALK